MRGIAKGGVKRVLQVLELELLRVGRSVPERNHHRNPSRSPECLEIRPYLQPLIVSDRRYSDRFYQEHDASIYHSCMSRHPEQKTCTSSTVLFCLHIPCQNPFIPRMEVRAVAHPAMVYSRRNRFQPVQL